MPARESNKVILLEHPSGSKAEVALYGATVTSWVVDGIERLFVSKLAKRDGSKAIRGGIPLCFPIFGTKEQIALPQHARNAWPHSFHLIYVVTLTSKSLQTFCELKNEDKESFEFNTLLHTYFRVPDCTEASVEGLTSCEYIDKVQNAAVLTEKNEKVTIGGEVDSVYKDVPDKIKLNAGNGSAIQIVKSNLKDTVVWNPWVEKAKGMGDFDDEEYKNMICVEAGSVADWVSLAPGQTWTAGQTLIIA
ncbi:galactose mutarotase-like domain-containing protein [Mycotypha africana]|uniref:galactose mutarotase-like domain-containing protein n=1 Tax=Mycotypha africana TaxID=64632 RepID=UPI0023014D04|nr:galactose mutarotase-like domain-containing protein [Mycotypha africana]KAI8992193.1 galactose mutarotase-like domain-containing protein [Mycotypha africana]